MEGKLAGEIEERKKIIDGYLAKIKSALEAFDAKYIFNKLKTGVYPHQIAGVNIDKQYIDDITNAYKERPDEDIYPDVVLNGDPKSGKDGLANMLGPKDSEARKDIDNAQKKNPDHPDNNPDSNNSKSDQEGSESSNQNKQDEEKNNADENQKEADEKQDDNFDVDSDNKEDVDSETSQEENIQGDQKNPNEEVNPSKNGVNNVFKGEAGEMGGNVAGSMVGGASGTAAAGAAEAATAGAATSAAVPAAAATLTATAPFWIALFIIIVVIIAVIVLGPMLDTGKFGNVKAEAVGNSGNYKVVSALSKADELKKTLETNLEEFITRIEEIKKNASGDNKDKIITLCDQILKESNELKSISTQNIRKMSAEDKGKKEELTVKIMAQIKELVSLVYVKTDVVYLNQIQVEGNMASWGCGYTSSAMVAQSYGFDLKPIQIAGNLTSGIPSAAWPAQRLTELTGVNWKQASSWDEIVKQVNNCNPVIVGTTFSRSSGHWMVIIGFTDSGDVIVNDPYGFHGYNYNGGYVSSGGETGKAVVYNLSDFRAHFDNDGYDGYSAYLVNPPYKLKCN